MSPEKKAMIPVSVAKWAVLAALLLIVICVASEPYGAAVDSNIPSGTVENPAIGGLPEGWTHDVLYANVCSSPVGMTPGEQGIMYINDRCGSRILTLFPDGSFSEWTTTGDVGMDSIVYQQNARRLVGSSGSDLYEITPQATIRIGSLPDRLGASTMIAHPNTDHVYAVAWGADTAIRHFDKDFNLLDTVQAVDHCVNMALDSDNDLLYFTESVAQRVSALNLVSGAVEVIRESIGSGCIDENVGVAVDDTGSVYYSSMTDGLFRYDSRLPSGEGETRLMDIPLGIGSIFWWSTQKVILQTNVFAGTIFKMDPGKAEAEPMEPNVNTPAIAAASDGTVYLYTDNRLFKVVDGELVAIGPKLEGHFSSMAIDASDHLLVPIDRWLYEVDLSDCSLKLHIEFEDGNYITRIEYDASHDEIVALTNYAAIAESVAIWRVSAAAGSVPRLLKIITLEESDESYMAVNRQQGDIYFYNQRENELARLDEETGTLVTLFDQVDEPGQGVIGGLSFFSPLNGFIITYLDQGRYLLPIDGAEKIVFNTMVCGMDSSQGVEDSRGHYVATHAGRVYRIRPEYPLSVNRSASDACFPDEFASTLSQMLLWLLRRGAT